jgi:hypothetical protein
MTARARFAASEQKLMAFKVLSLITVFFGGQIGLVNIVVLINNDNGMRLRVKSQVKKAFVLLQRK